MKLQIRVLDNDEVLSECDFLFSKGGERRVEQVLIMAAKGIAPAILRGWCHLIVADPPEEEK
jgi:hypothetical protein